MKRLFEKVKPWRMFKQPEILNITRRDCMKCRYAIGSSLEDNKAQITCDYIRIKGCSRPCQPGQCRETGVFEARNSRTKRDERSN